MNRIILLLISAIFMAFFCDDAAAKPKPNMEACRGSNRLLLQFKVITRNTKIGASKLSGFPRTQHFSAGYDQEIIGDCAPLLFAYNETNYYFPKSTVVTYESGPPNREPKLTFSKNQSLKDVLAIDSNENHPSGIEGRFIMATNVVTSWTPGTSTGKYLGLWREGATSKVYAFSKQSNGRFTVPKLIFKSSLPLRSIAYFPFSHSGSGRIHLVQELGKGRVRLFSLDWDYSKYPCKRGEYCGMFPY